MVRVWTTQLLITQVWPPPTTSDAAAAVAKKLNMDHGCVSDFGNNLGMGKMTTCFSLVNISTSLQHVRILHKTQTRGHPSKVHPLLLSLSSHPDAGCNYWVMNGGRGRQQILRAIERGRRRRKIGEGSSMAAAAAATVRGQLNLN